MSAKPSHSPGALRPKYDVAISFLARDSVQASDLNDRLGAGLDVFYFPRQQEALAGTDGLETMRQAFRLESRLNVVLFDQGWGATPWTRVEETAIKERCLNDGWRTLFFVTLKTGLTLPKWLPETTIYLNLQDYGIEGAAGAIKARVQELGGEIHAETLASKAARVERARQYELRRKQFAFSFEGVAAANAAFASLKDSIRTRLAALPGDYRTKDDPQGPLIIFGFEKPLKVIWSSHYGNSLEAAELVIERWDGHPAISNGWVIDSSRLGSARYTPDMSEAGGVGWFVDGAVLEPESFADLLISRELEKSLNGRRR